MFQKIELFFQISENDYRCHKFSIVSGYRRFRGAVICGEKSYDRGSMVTIHTAEFREWALNNNRIYISVINTGSMTRPFFLQVGLRQKLWHVAPRLYFRQQGYVTIVDHVIIFSTIYDTQLNEIYSILYSKQS